MERAVAHSVAISTSGHAGALAATALVATLLCGTAIPVGTAWAVTPEEAREKCRLTVGRQMVQACMQKQAGATLGECRAQARPQVQACIAKALSNARPNVPVAVPEEKGNVAPDPDAEPAPFVAPPRTISDITAILDAEKPDPEKIDQLKAKADATPPAGASGEALARFYFERGNARADLGRLYEAIQDADAAMKVGGSISANLEGRIEQFAAVQYKAAGNLRRALEILSHQVQVTANAPGAKGFQFSGNRQISGVLIELGDLQRADAHLQRNLDLIREARTSGVPRWRAIYGRLGQSWEADVEWHRAIMFESRGQHQEAEKAYRLAERRRRASIEAVLSAPNPPTKSQLLFIADAIVLHLARTIGRQGRLAEAEAEMRRALLSRLREQGKYHPLTPLFVIGLGGILVEQGRYPEAEQLARVALEINRAMGIAPDAQSTAQLLLGLGSILSLQNRSEEAAQVFAELDRSVANWDDQRRRAFDVAGWRIHALYAAGKIDAGLAAAKERLALTVARLGENHYDAAAARGILAIGYLKAERYAEAAAEMSTVIPIMIKDARDGENDDNMTGVAAHQRRLQHFVEAYVTALAASRGQTGEVAAQTFSLGDVVRAQSVQQAVAASSARMLAKDPALTELIRKEQDLSKQVNALLGTLNNALSIPSSQRDEGAVAALRGSISAAREARDQARAEIARRFPSYADLIDPTPPSVKDIQAALRGDEALLSFYFGYQTSFMWAVPKEGPAVFARIETTAEQVRAKVDKLRAALEPKVAMIDEIPPFDLAVAEELYNLLLRPVETVWKPARNLIVVTNGALGLLPLSLLPTAPIQLAAGEQTLFASYRQVPWLVRSHAVSTVPSVAALRTLRNLPPGSVNREPIIGFGDPFFSAEQALEAKSVQVASVGGRGLPFRRRLGVRTRDVDSADLALLPRLPDTADELRSIARALRTDPSRVLFLGKEANEQTVRASDLSRFRIVAFSTHGLLPGDLDGLTQPALALSAPAVAGVEGDGLLTMEEILPLKLDADWIVLSACNTGAGAGAGAEAASGLGRAFFYAGSRSLLVTNWSVHSASATELVSGIFRRQAADPRLTRAEALRQSMIALMDGPGSVGPDGKPEYTYAHPLFWAPYSIIGDGG